MKDKKPPTVPPITKRRLLIVEGQDEEGFFRAMLKDLKEERIQVLAIGGKDKLKANLGVLANAPGFRDAEALAIVRDADKSDQELLDEPGPSAFDVAWRKVIGALFSVSLPQPTAHGKFAAGPPRIGVFIVPDGACDGMLEDLCLKSVKNDPASACMDGYFACLALAGLAQRLPAKAKLATFLASRRETDPRLGIAAQRGSFPFGSEVFDPLRAFLDELKR